MDYGEVGTSDEKRVRILAERRPPPPIKPYTNNTIREIIAEETTFKSLDAPMCVMDPKFALQNDLSIVEICTFMEIPSPML